MKRRALCLAAALTLCVLLSGCSGSGDKAPASVGCAALGEAILQGQDFSPEMTQMSENRLYVLLELDEPQATDAYMAIDASRTTAEAIIAVTASDGHAGDVAALLEAFRDSLLAQYRDYQPLEVPKLEAAQVMTRGSQCVLVIAPDQQLAKNACEAKWNE